MRAEVGTKEARGRRGTEAGNGGRGRRPARRASRQTGRDTTRENEQHFLLRNVTSSSAGPALSFLIHTIRGTASPKTNNPYAKQPLARVTHPPRSQCDVLGRGLEKMKDLLYRPHLSRCSLASIPHPSPTSFAPLFSCFTVRAATSLLTSETGLYAAAAALSCLSVILIVLPSSPAIKVVRWGKESHRISRCCTNLTSCQCYLRLKINSMSLLPTIDAAFSCVEKLVIFLYSQLTSEGALS